MNFHIDKRFELIRNDILEVISDFDAFETGFGTGKRNSVKKIQIADRTVIIKSFKIPNFINQIVYKYFRKSKAQRSFEYGNKLLDLHIKTPQPIAFIETFSLFGIQRSFYISEFVNYDLTYRELINQPEIPNREIMLNAFTRFTYALHEKGVKFLDHSPGNTLIVKKENNYDFYLVDLNRMLFGELNFEERMENFSRLTPKQEMVKTMSEEYAKLSGEKFNKVYTGMWLTTQHFFEKRHRKAHLKSRFLGKK